MTNRRTLGLALIFAVAGVLLAGLLRACLTPIYEEQQRGPDAIERAFLPAATPAVPLALRWCIDTDHCQATPLPIPTHHPDYAPGRNYPQGLECNGYLPNVWGSAPSGCSGDTCATTNIDWTYVDDCIASAAAYTVTLRDTTAISMPVAIMLPPYFADDEPDGSCGTVGDPCGTEYVPTWMESDFRTTFTYSGGTYWGYKYDDPETLTYFKAMINEAADLYADNPQVAFIRICPGFQCEVQSVKVGALGDAGNDALRTAFEASGVTCREYRDFITALTNETLEQFPNKTVVLPVGPPGCGDNTYDEDYQFRYNYLNTTTDGNPGYWSFATPTPVGIALYALAPSYANAMRWGGNSGGQDWGFYTTGTRADSLGLPVVYEFKYNAPDGEISHEDKWQFAYWAMLSGSGNAGDFALSNYTWHTFYSRQYWDAVWNKLGDHDDYAYSVMRDAELPYYTWSSGTYGTSDTRGNFENKLTLLNADNNAQACSAGVKSIATAAVAAAVAGGGTIEYNPCPLALPTRAPTLQPTPSNDAAGDANMLQRLLDRQARQVADSGSLVFAADADWAYYGDTRAVTITVTYLNDGTDTFSLTAPTTAGGVTSSSTITKTNSDLWTTATWTVNAYIGNVLAEAPGDAFLVLENDSGIEYVHQVEIVAGAITSGATATPTSTASPTATRTRTPRPTATFVTATATRTPTATPDWVTLNCPAITPVVDASLGEWTAVTPVALSAASARVIQPPTPLAGGSPTPTSLDLSGLLYCGHAGDLLYLAGKISDTITTAGTTYNTLGRISLGDAVRITLDGQGDGLAVVRGDDHDLYVSPGGRVLDFDRYPISATLATVLIPGNGWRFELLLNRSELELGPLTAGRRWGLVWGLLDDDDGTGLQHAITDRKRWATVP